VAGSTNIFDNDDVGAWYNKPFDFKFVPGTDKIIVWPKKVVLAKFALVDKFFMPNSDNCLFDSMLFDLEAEVADRDEEILVLKEKVRRLKFSRPFIIIGSIAAGILSGWGIGKLVVKLGTD
jgi:hypothetical protein